MDGGPAPTFRRQLLFDDFLVLQGGGQKVTKILFIDLRDAKGRVLFAWMRFKIITHQLNCLQKVAVRPDFFGFFIFGVLHAFQVFIKNQFLETVRGEARKIMGNQKTQADDRDEKASAAGHGTAGGIARSPAAQAGSVRSQAGSSG